MEVWDIAGPSCVQIGWAGAGTFRTSLDGRTKFADAHPSVSESPSLTVRLSDRLAANRRLEYSKLASYSSLFHAWADGQTAERPGRLVRTCLGWLLGESLLALEPGRAVAVPSWPSTLHSGQKHGQSHLWELNKSISLDMMLRKVIWASASCHSIDDSLPSLARSLSLHAHYPHPLSIHLSP